MSIPDCATAWQAGFAHFERWETGGQTADRDAAIAYLEDALADPPEGLNLDLHLALAGLYSARAGRPRVRRGVRRRRVRCDQARALRARRLARRARLCIRSGGRRL